MAFSTILTGTIVVYAIYYAVVIAYDLFAVPATTSLYSQEEEIEISEEENSIATSSFPSSSSSETSFSSNSDESEEAPFFPTEGASGHHSKKGVEEVVSKNGAAMNGGVFLGDLFEQVQNAETPEELAFVNQVWQ